MKKIKFLILILSVIAGFNSIIGQSGGRATISPPAFTAEDEITITVDVSGVPNLSGVEPLYLWAWSNSGDAPNGGWTASAETARMTKVAANLWSYTMTPAAYYGKNPSEMQFIGFLVKAKDGTGDKKSGDFSPNKIDPLTFTASQFRNFPARVGANDVVTVYLNKGISPDIETQRMTPKTVEITAKDGGVTKSSISNLKLEADGSYSASFIPSVIWGNTAGKPTAVDYKFKGDGRDATGKISSVESGTGTISLFNF
jgi:hypothetical protein